MVNLVGMGEFFSKCRKECGLSQENVASITSISEKTIYNIEHGKCEPELDTVLMFCDIYGIELNQVQKFYSRSSDMSHMIDEYYSDKVKSFAEEDIQEEKLYI